MHAILMKHFRGKVGEQRVVKELYSLTRSNGMGSELHWRNWHSVIQTGDAVTMSMVLGADPDKPTSDCSHCPKRGKTELGTFRDREWLVW